MGTVAVRGYDLSAFEWLGKELRAKVARYEVSQRSTGEQPPNWEEKAGVFTHMDNELQKDLAYLLAYGDWKEHGTQYKKVLQFLTQSIYVVVEKKRKRKKEELAEICQRIANMELYYFLYPHIETHVSETGRLWFTGVDELISYDNYRKNWKKHSENLRELLIQAKYDAWVYIDEYRRNLEE